MVYTIYMGKVESLVFLYSSFPDIYKWWNIQIHVFDRGIVIVFIFHSCEEIIDLFMCWHKQIQNYNCPYFLDLVFKNSWLSQSH